MKRYYFLILIALAFLPISCSQHEKREQKYPDGSLQEAFEVIKTENGSFIKDGEYKTWYPGGQPELAGSYISGKKSGNWKKWFENGQMNSDVNYKNDTLDGNYVMWYKNGRKSSEGKKMMDKSVGTLTTWYEDGQMQAQGQFNDQGKAEGAHIFWNNKGTKVAEEHYKEGRLDGEVKYWDQNGKLACSREFKDGEDINLPVTFKNASGDKLELMQGGKYKFTYAKPSFFRPNSIGDFIVFRSNTIQFSGTRMSWGFRRFNKDTLIKSNSFDKDELFTRMK